MSKEHGFAGDAMERRNTIFVSMKVGLLQISTHKRSARNTIQLYKYILNTDILYLKK